MQNKKIFLLFLILVVLSVAVYFITRPQRQEEILPQKFAQLPEKPKLIDEFHQNTRIYSVAISPVDSSIIAFVDEYGTLKLWRRNITDKPAQILEDFPEKFRSIGFSPTGKLLASSSYRKGKLVLWDVATGKKLNSIQPSSRQFAFSPDGQQLATVYNEVKLWDIRNPKHIVEIVTLPYDVSHKPIGYATVVAMSPDGTFIAEGYSHGTINVWNLKSKQLVKSLKIPFSETYFLKFSPDNKFLTAGGPEVYTDENNEKWVSSKTKGYMMWKLQSWKRLDSIQRGNIENLVFSPDGKICVSANDESFSGRGVELWSVENGAPITSLPVQARNVAFSHDGRMLVTGGWNGVVQVWELTLQHLNLSTTPSDFVRLIYYLPNDKPPPPDTVEKLDRSIRKVQKFYADEMERHGLGRKTFEFETDENGKAKVNLVREDQNISFDLSNDIWLIVKDESILALPSKFNIYSWDDMEFWHKRHRAFSSIENVWMGEIKGFTQGFRIAISATKEGFDWRVAAHELKYSFAALDWTLQTHNFETNRFKRFFSGINDAMPWNKNWVKLSKCEAGLLDKCRFFNPNQSFFDKPPEMTMKISPLDKSDSRLFQFEISDRDGIHQAQLFVPIDMKNQRWRKKSHDCQSLNGKERVTVVFEISDPEIETVVLQMIDMHGNIAAREFIIREKTEEK